MNKTCPKCGHLIRHHYVNDESFDILSLTCPADDSWKRAQRNRDCIEDAERD